MFTFVSVGRVLKNVFGLKIEETTAADWKRRSFMVSIPHQQLLRVIKDR
jgi:hypothetical protein